MRLNETSKFSDSSYLVLRPMQGKLHTEKSIPINTNEHTKNVQTFKILLLLSLSGYSTKPKSNKILIAVIKRSKAKIF
jgi:hypothetical protein